MLRHWRSCLLWNMAQAKKRGGPESYEANTPSNILQFNFAAFDCHQANLTGITMKKYKAPKQKHWKRGRQQERAMLAFEHA